MITSVFAALLAAGAAASATAAPAPTTTAPRSLQENFDAASRAIDEGRFIEGVKTFEAIEQRPAIQRSPVALGTLLTRKGAGLMVMDRLPEAETALRAGLKLIPVERTDMRTDRFLAQHALGWVALKQLNYAAAAAAFKESLALAFDSGTRIRALTALSRATAFDPGDESIRYAEEALALAKAEPDLAKAKTTLAGIETLRGRALLNHGRVNEAYDVLLKAVSKQGGLDLKVDADEIITRSDLAIAALLSGKEDSARKYLAYTGAGRISEAPFQTAADMRPPACGGPADLKPEDVAVVEFSIRDDGAIGLASPIYASVNGPAAFEFARAVRDWSWQPEAVAKIPALFRTVTRVELSCSTSTARPSISQPIFAALSDWVRTLPGEIPPQPASDAAALAPLKAELTKREAAGGGLATLPVLVSLSKNTVASREERQNWLIRARDLAVGAHGPIAARVAIETALAETSFDWTKRGGDAFRASLRAILARAEVSADAVAADTLRLMIAEQLYRSPAPADAATLLLEVADDTRLSKSHQLRIGALVRLATIQASSGDLAGASASYNRTGLDIKQCALLDAQPVLLPKSSYGSDFPMEAMRWGFEGWVRTEYDILPDGKTSAQRAIIAYPPCVFRKAALAVTRDFTYAKSFRPDGSAGCGGKQQGINFQLPWLRR